LHNGTWGVIFGNGFSSQTGDGGIYIMTVDPSTAAKTFYYLTTNTTTGSGNGIAYVSPADLDGDHITDYVYAGDLKGNVWRFDLTSTDPTNWGTTAPRLLFTTLTGQPITTKLQLVATAAATGGAPQLLIDFGTGQKTTLTNTTPDSYIGGTQSLYGIWDWDMTNWNSKSSVAYTGLTAAGTGLSSPYKIAKTNLQLQSFVASTTSPGSMSGTANAVCWVAPVGSCTTATDNNKLGWYSDLQVSGGLSEQVVFNPVFFQGAFLVNATTPANNVPTSCSVVQDTGLTYTLDAATGAIIPNAFPTYADLSLAGIATNATGTPYVVTTAEGTINIVYQTFSGTPAAKIINPPSNTKSKRLTWVELR
jgi:type IV pilus assembly protein PilY1